MTFSFFFGWLVGLMTTFSSSDSGAQYYDGTCDTTRTVHFGRPTSEMSEAYTRVLQGHVSFFLFHCSISISIHICSILSPLFFFFWFIDN